MGGGAGTFITTFLVNTQMGAPPILLTALINVWKRDRERFFNSSYVMSPKTCYNEYILVFTLDQDSTVVS